jgi:hypothetical protein
MQEPSSRTHGTAYALKGTALVHISSVSRGLGCGCVCPQCLMKVVARKGRIRRQHFAHHRPTVCDGGLETILHRLAKELFVTLGSISLPEYHFRLARNIKNGSVIEVQELVVPRNVVKIGAVKIESRLKHIIPDVVLNPGPEELLVEIAVTHVIGRDKLRAVRRIGVPTIEIRLNTEDIWLTRAVLQAKLSNDTKCKYWIFHPNQREPERRFYDLLRRNAREVRWRRRNRQQSQSELLAKARRPEPPMQKSSSSVHWRAADQFAEEFNRRHGRYPSLAENKIYFSRKGTRSS